MSRLSLIGAQTAILVLSGCAGLSTSPDAQPGWLEHKARLESMTHWTANGKIALRTPDKSESGTLLWQQMGEATHLRLSGPMGLSATTVDSDGQHLEIRKGKDYSRWPVAQYEQEYPGWNLPLTALPHWLKGVPDPELPVEQLTLDTAGQLPQILQQQGWTVTYESFERFDGKQLPTRMRLSREDTKARIILRDWQDASN